MEAFPFHLILHKDLSIHQIGDGLRKLIPTIKPGKHFQEFLPEHNSAARLSYHEIESRIRNTFHFQSHTNSSIELKGGFYSINDSYLLFLAYPIIRKISDIEKLSLKFGDIARHDSYLNYIAILQAKEALRSDSNALVNQLENLVARRTKQLQGRTVALEESEAMFRQAARTARLGHWSFDETSGVFLSISDEYARIFGYTVDEFLKNYKTLEQYIELIYPEDQAKIAKVYEEGRHLDIEYRIVRVDGSVRTVVENYEPWSYARSRHVRYNGTLQDITELRHIEERARELQDTQLKLTEALADAQRAARLVKLGTYEWDWAMDRMVVCSAEFARIHELSVDETLAAYSSVESIYSFIHPDDRERIVALEAEAVGNGEGYIAAYRMLSPSGQIRHVREVCEVELDDQGKVIRSLGSVQDVSEQIELEEQFRQAQKMEAVGTLAGGIAHDFNNLLTVIEGYDDLLLESLKPDDPLHFGLSEIKKASDRADTLTRQLLAFSRKQILQPKVIDMSKIVAEMENMLRRLIGEHIEFDVRHDSGLKMVKADPGQMDQVIMNLMVNARDAMPQGGKITMSIENVALDEQTSVVFGDLRAGDYVMLSISDTGIGMGEKTLPHIFEPFYTTKGPEEGTGLGLSTVFGIVRQSGGSIEVESEPGKGSTFRIYIPHVEASESVAEEQEQFTSSGEICETIMVVEDEEMIRVLLKRILEGCGYTVLTAHDGEEALLIAERHEESIDLMITDVVMPQMSGHELAERLGPLRPEMSVLYMSGYDDKMVADQGPVDGDRHFLQKPFRPNDVANKIRKILDKERNPPTKDDQTVIVQGGSKVVNI